MAIVVIGGTGFIGSHVTKELIDQKEDIVTINRHPNTNVLESLSVDSRNVKTVKGDISDIDNFQILAKNASMQEIGGIIHLASLLSTRTRANPRLGFDINVRGVYNVLEFARRVDVKKIVYISSCSVYGSTQYEPIDEKHPTNPEDLYGLTKLCAEIWGTNFSKLYGLDFITLRLGSTYGPGQVGQPKHAMVVTLIENAFFKRYVQWPTRGIHKTNLVYVKDAAHAICLAYHSKQLKHKIFNISSGVQHTFKEISDVVNEFIPKASITLGNRALESEKLGLMDITRAKNELQYEPEYSLRSGVKDYLNWLHVNKRWWKLKTEA